MKNRLDRLVLIYRTLAHGDYSVLYADRDLYVAQRTGKPGMIVAINNGTQSRKQVINTPYRLATLYDYSETTGETIKTDIFGRAVIETPAKSYTIWSLKNF